MVLGHVLQRGAAFRERGAALRVLTNAGKARVIAVDCPHEKLNFEPMTVVGGSPGEKGQVLFVARDGNLGRFVVTILSSAMNGIDSVVWQKGSAPGESPDTKVQAFFPRGI